MNTLVMPSIEAIVAKLKDVAPVDNEEFIRAVNILNSGYISNSPRLKPTGPSIMDTDDRRVVVSLADNGIGRAFTALNRHCEKHFGDKWQTVAEAMTLRFHSLHDFIANEEEILLEIGVIRRDDGVSEFREFHQSLYWIGASLPLNATVGFDRNLFFPAIDILLKRDARPVPPARQTGRPHLPLPDDGSDMLAGFKKMESLGLLNIEQDIPWNGFHQATQIWLQQFVMLRTMQEHADPSTGVVEANPDLTELSAWINSWIKRNPVFTSVDLECLKRILKGEGLPRIFTENILQDMRGKTYKDLLETLFQASIRPAPASKAL
jgi:hypothetical protein